jgi:hypothetical protein
LYFKTHLLIAKIAVVMTSRYPEDFVLINF